MTRRRWWLIGVTAALVVAAVIGVVIWQTASRPATAEDAVVAYLRALASGDAAAVEATRMEVSATALDAFTAASELIEDPEVTSVREVTPGEATADVSFTLGEEERTAELALERVDGRWIVDPSALGTMTATAAIGSFVGIGAATFAVGEATSLLPAEYAVTAAPSSILDGKSTLLVLPGESAEITVDATLGPEATDAAQQQLDEHLEACTAPASTMPDTCGIRIPWGTEFRAVSDIRYRIEQTPSIALTADAFMAAGGVLVATVTGTGQDGSARTTTYRTEDWGLRGDVRFTEDGLTLSVW
ncbi:hypothetical protein [Microbacterium sp. SA39]|uniref:hypothetical protein n=1 Tax=Microbacterium sp. SA39 TaxID=1263625 RepID=UPI0005FA6B44|nr:hypothetical protein [Microbacterium sp. SA39]KJQ53520.1 hypothetical protein RS85_02549 [Microbacterium sp. SA39]